jgi:hypothetical protein
MSKPKVVLSGIGRDGTWTIERRRGAYNVIFIDANGRDTSMNGLTSFESALQSARWEAEHHAEFLESCAARARAEMLLK